MSRELQDDVYPFLFDKVNHILSLPHENHREWTVQGFGMMRTYLDEDKTWRLNIYHPDLAIKNVSEVHSHPWSFMSWIIAGTLTNTRYSVRRHNPIYDDALYMHGARIMTGIKSNVGDAGAGGVAPQFDAWLVPYQISRMKPGEIYEMEAPEVHKTAYTAGCVTLNRRVVAPGDTGEHADVYWPHGTDWVSAKPRLATTHEIGFLTTCALAIIRGHQ